jgi:hypothetical protein
MLSTTAQDLPKIGESSRDEMSVFGGFVDDRVISRANKKRVKQQHPNRI